MNPLIAVAQSMADGLAWGKAAKQASSPFKSVEEAAKAANSPELEKVKAAFAQLFAKDGQGVKLFDAVDLLMDEHPDFEDLREYLMDICVVQLLSELEEEEDDAFDSPEWEKIEKASEDRGTELLNALIYIKDCKLSEMEPSLEDFLYEFLLAEEDDFQEELSIYEPFVKNIEMIDAPLKQLVQVGNNLRDNDMRELFSPLMLFFREQEQKPGILTLALMEGSAEPEVHTALYQGLCKFAQAEI
jgi:hypothetical protein